MRTGAVSTRIGAVGALLVVIGCGDGRETLLQLDVTIPADVVVRSLDINIGEVARRTYEGKLPMPNTPLGLDLVLPRSISGEHHLMVMGIDANDCIAAAKDVVLAFHPGQRISAGLVPLEALPKPLCATIDAAEPGPLDDGGVPPAVDAGDDEVAPTPDPVPGADAEPGPSDAGAPDQAQPSQPDAAATADLRPADANPPDMPAGIDVARPPVDMGSPKPDVPVGPRMCSGAAPCGKEENCLGGICRAAAADCAEIAAQAPGAADGVYVVRIGGKPQPAYCDMRLKRVLCTTTAGDHAGRTRDGSDLPFVMKTVLELPDNCRVWGVRHATDQHPLDELVNVATTAGAKVKSTCEALGFRGQTELSKKCYYGSLAHCGFNVPVRTGPGGRHVAKWGNSCDCNPNRLKPFYTFEVGIHVSHIPWDMSGTHAARCRVR